MDSWKHLCLQLFVLCMLKDAFPLQIHFNESFVGVHGKNTTTLECSFDKEDSEEILSLLLLVKNVTAAKFVQIVRFRPNIPSLLLPYGSYLSERVILSNFTSMSSTATLTFQPLECRDETAYQCKITYYKSNAEQTNITKTANLTVTVNPSIPHIVLDTSSAVEGDNITLTCAGNVGKPRRTFIWQKRKGSSISDPYRNVTTKFTTILDACSYQGTSNLTIKVSDEDDNAVIRCSVNNSYGEEYYNETKPLDVKYKVRKPSITREPMKNEYIQGSNPIKLACIGRGNPQPSYTWFKDGNMDEILNSSNILCITEVITNNSGEYRCNASNIICGIEYTESTVVNIKIVKKETTTPTTTEKPTGIIVVIMIVVGVVAIVISVVIIGCCIHRKKRSKSDKEKLIRQDMVRNVDGYDSVLLDKRNGIRDKHAESQSHHNLVYDPNDTHKTAEENINKENDTQGPDTRNEYASLNEATKLKNRTIGKMPVENQRKSNQDDMEDTYMESKGNTYAHLGEKHQHKTDETTEMYAKAGELTDRL